MEFETTKMMQSISSQAKTGLLWGALFGAAIAIVILTLADLMYFSLLGSIVVLFTGSVLGAAVGGLIGTSIGVDYVELISNEF